MKTFVSYDQNDSVEYDNLADALRLASVDYDPVRLTAGTYLPDELRTAVNSCEICIFLCTSRSIKSTWCMAELGAFWGAGKSVIVFIAERNVDTKKLPPQFVGDIWTQSVKEMIAAVSAPSPVAVKENQRKMIPGRRLYKYPDHYPIDVESGTYRPSINSTRFGEAIDYLLGDDVDDRLAAMDLVYLRKANATQVRDVVPTDHLEQYKRLIEKYSLRSFVDDFKSEKERVFRNYIRIVNDIGDTLRGVSFEILLHDVRNPIRSIIAARNTDEVSGRKIGDPATRFVVEYVKNQGRYIEAAMESGRHVAYRKKFTYTKEVKATTTLVFDDLYGLVGILCLNIDIEEIDKLTAKGKKEFFKSYTEITGETPDLEEEGWSPPDPKKK